MNGAKTANPGMQPAEAFLRDLDIMVRTLVAGAVAPRAEAAGGKVRREKNCPEKVR